MSGENRPAPQTPEAFAAGLWDAKDGESYAEGSGLTGKFAKDTNQLIVEFPGMTEEAAAQYLVAAGDRYGD